MDWTAPDCNHMAVANVDVVVVDDDMATFGLEEEKCCRVLVVVAAVVVGPEVVEVVDAGAETGDCSNLAFNQIAEEGVTALARFWRAMPPCNG